MLFLYNNDMNNKKVHQIIVVLFLTTLFLGLTGVSFAYFNSTSTFQNEFSAGEFSTSGTETFVSPTNWLPGDETPKTLDIKNEGSIPMAVRVSYTESWKDSNDQDLPLEVNGIPSTIINLDNTDDWTVRGDYIYYNGSLDPLETASSPIKSVTFNKEIVDTPTCTTTNGVTNCTNTYNGYEDATYTLTFIVETVQANAKYEVWNLPRLAFVNRQNQNQITVGDEISLDTEHFYVVSSNQNETVLLSKYNLLVGDVFDIDTTYGETYTYVKTLSSNDSGFGLQDSTARGAIFAENQFSYRWIGTVGFSSSNYWDNSICSIYNSVHDCSLDSALLPEYSPNGEEYYIAPYPYVYRSNLGSNIPEDIDLNSGFGSGFGVLRNNGYTISYYVERYISLLKSLGAPSTIEGRLLSTEEAASLGCDTTFDWGEYFWCSSVDDENNPATGTAPSWVYSTSYWLGSVAHFNAPWIILSTGEMQYQMPFLEGDAGIRPVIVVPTSEIQ